MEVKYLSRWGQKIVLRVRRQFFGLNSAVQLFLKLRSGRFA